MSRSITLSINTPKEIGYSKFISNCSTNVRLENERNILNKNRVDFPPCKQRQRMALSAVSVLTNLQKVLESPRVPVSLLLINVAQYAEPKHSSANEFALKNTKKKLHKVIFKIIKFNRFYWNYFKFFFFYFVFLVLQISMKEVEDLIKDTNVLTISEASRWKWESIRFLLKVRKNALFYIYIFAVFSCRFFIYFFSFILAVRQ